LPFLDLIQERTIGLVAVSLRDRDDQTQVGCDHLLFGIQRAALDLLRESDLVLGGEESHLADLPEKQL
jgi:hypothetical protein